MPKCDIAIQFDRSDRTYSGGDVISGEVVVSVNTDINCNGIVLTHYWGTHGRGNKDTGTKHEIPLCDSQPLQAGEELRLRFEFQSELWPLTYHGEYINVDHYVHVAVDVPWAIDPKHAEEFIVLAGQRPTQFSGDRSEVVEMKVKTSSDAAMSLTVKLIVGVVVFALLAVLITFAVFLLPVMLVGGLFYWLRKRAIKGRVGEVNVRTPVLVVSPGEDWPCELSFTPQKTFRINEVSARLLVQESATSGSGTNSTTHRHTLFDDKQVILPAGQLMAGQPFSESLHIRLPETDAWSLDASDNKIEWTMDLRIDIPRFPDWSHKTTLQMIPSDFLNDVTEHWLNTTGTQIPFDDSGEPSAVDDPEASPSTLPLFELVSSINNADRYGNERSKVVVAAAGRTFDVAIIVDRVSTTLGFSGNTSEAHRHGRTVLGTIAGTEQEVQLFTRQHNNAPVDAVARDEVWESQATVDKWDSLYNRLVMLEV